ncbi:uncharacterized protein N7473_010174 [Penicillium subrubescens]|uniref:Uncharacterized protein n=1 Tax=Penicillium subrubescens TaxID=1316194 RepID=A0A1Q5U194_9EURO|nr:uncharacterized protein N7473_010174 [Penicillium subrubescens]KAJ5883288.1 hypothetical protein N7473_010174 [Penicillium subrubescens]OKP06252.1 hypothetical protein PENSUB_6242 [Penicillium subrubescens]
MFFKIPPPRQFLVLSATSSAPFDPSHKFLVLSPTESGPDSRVYDEQAVTESATVEHEQELHRSNSSSSTSSEASQIDEDAATLPSGFLFLGHTKGRRASQ